MSNTQEEFQAGGESSPLNVMWFETHLGARYELPDMLSKHITLAHRQLDEAGDLVSVLNVSDVVLLLPRRIIKKAGVGDRCFWEAQ